MPPLYVVLVGVGLIFFSTMNAQHSTAAATGDTLAVGQALAVGDKLVSRNDKFSLGFFRFPSSLGIISKSTDNTTASYPGWYLGIWFNKITVFTTVWVANRDFPITESEIKMAQLKISGDGNLAIIIVVTKTNTESIIWYTSGVIANSTHANRVVLMNTGNLALIPKSPSKGVPLWQSFDYPTDVMLPTAKIGRNFVTGFSQSLISKKSIIDPGFGSYSIEVGTDGVLRLTSLSFPSVLYWSWPAGRFAELNGIIDSDPRTKGLLKFTYKDNNEEVFFTYTLTDESFSSFISLDITSAQFELNVWSQPAESWQTVFSMPSDFCRSPGICGPFTVCNGNLSPLFCGCMEGFYQKSPLDWELGDRRGGCARNTRLDCIGSNNSKASSKDAFHPIVNVTLPNYPRGIEDATTQSNCETACINDCSCTAYSYDKSKCSIWHGELLNVNMNDGISIFSQDVLYIRLSGESNKRISRFTIAAIVVTFGLLLLMLLFIIWRNRFKWFNTPLHNIGGSSGIIAFRYTDLVRATKNFSERLGGGGFGSVFKGGLSESAPIAVKRLDSARQGEKQFRAEVSSIGLIQHINLVKLIGFCCDSDKRLLVYEHMSNGSLDSHLFQSNASVLNWNNRYQIAIGVARGLCYLHQSCRECIIHCDIKPENILLDAAFVPKIADFGMAAFVGRDFSRVLTTFRATVGYLAPEWLSGVAVTPKVDVYSFGMVLMEIISGRRNSPEVYTSNSYHVSYFPVQAISKLHEGDIDSLVDPLLQGHFDSEEAERVCKVACWCIQDNEFDRPTIGEVVRVLEGLQELDLPPMPRLLAAITEHSDEASA